MNQCNQSTCCTCGYQWIAGQHGLHDCSQVLSEKLRKVEQELTQLKAQLRGAFEVDVYELDGQSEGLKRNYGLVLIGPKGKTWNPDIVDLVQNEFSRVLSSAQYELRFVKTTGDGFQLVQSLADALEHVDDNNRPVT